MELWNRKRINNKIRITSIHLIMGLWFVALSLSMSQAADVTLTVGDGSGVPGSVDNPVEVSLDNPSDKITGIEVAICDTDDYLSCSECITTVRTSGFECLVNEDSKPEETTYRCCKVVLGSLAGGGPIETGTGPVFELRHDVSGDAPEGECIDLKPEAVKFLDESKTPFTGDVVTEPGEFCFSSSPTTTTTTPSIDILQDPMWKSRWMPLPYLMVIEGKGTHFETFETELSFEPPPVIFPCFHIIWDNYYIWDFVLVMPGWLAGFEDQTVTVTATTGDETVEDDFEVKLLPFILKNPNP